MTMNINYKLYALLITIFMLFNLSCEDDYPLIFENNSTYSLIASDIIETIGAVYLELLKQNEQE